jgi:hypothetical protein
MLVAILHKAIPIYMIVQVSPSMHREMPALNDSLKRLRQVIVAESGVDDVAQLFVMTSPANWLQSPHTARPTTLFRRPSRRMGTPNPPSRQHQTPAGTALSRR